MLQLWVSETSASNFLSISERLNTTFFPQKLGCWRNSAFEKYLFEKELKNVEKSANSRLVKTDPYFLPANGLSPNFEEAEK